MSTKPLAVRQAELHDGLERPFYFTSGDRELFGWLYQPAARASSSLGLVICKPIGYESICAHRSVRAVAEAARALRLPVLCFDYVGTGDSDDHPPEAEQLTLWKSNVLSAIDELQRRCGVSAVGLLGFRLGASLASMAATESDQVAALVAIAPVVSGSRYLRELRTSRLLSVGDTPVVLAAEHARARLSSLSSDTAGALEASGAKLSAATVAALAQLDLEELDGLAAIDVLIVDRGDIPSARSWSERLRERHARTQYLTAPGFVQMMMTAPHLGAVSTQMIDTIQRWLQGVERTLGAAAPSSKNIQPLAQHDSAVLLRSTELGGREIALERAVFFGQAPPLFGVVSEPRFGEMRRRGVILLNSAADYHIGPNRLYVSLARRWAQRGYIVLRMDLAGIGDSGTREGRPSDEVFPPGAIDDISAAIKFLRDQYAVREATIAGLCSGAFHALQAANAGLPVNRILMINPRNFFWKQGMKIDDAQLWEATQYSSALHARALSAHYWRRLLSGNVDISRVLRLGRHRIRLALEPLLRDAARRMRIPLADDIGSELEAIAARGVHIVFAFARGDGGDELLHILAGSSIKRLGKRCRVHIIDGANHGFTRADSRTALESILSDELFSGPVYRLQRATAAATLRGVS